VNVCGGAAARRRSERWSKAVSAKADRWSELEVSQRAQSEFSVSTLVFCCGTVRKLYFVNL